MSAIVVQLFIVSWAIGTKQHQCTNKRSRRITSVYPSDTRRIQGWDWNPYLAKQSSSLVRTTDQSHIECGEIATKLVEVVYGPYGSTPISSCCSFGLSIMHLRNRALGARWEIIWSYLLANNKEKQVKFGSNQLVGYKDGFNELLQWSKLFLVNQWELLHKPSPIINTHHNPIKISIPHFWLIDYTSTTICLQGPTSNWVHASLQANTTICKNCLH
jgi:hypothetical protein